MRRVGSDAASRARVITWQGALRRGLLLSAAVLATAAGAAPLTGELQKQVRAATFEVVLKKPEKDTLTYEKPLPLELIPFQERNDKYRSVGTAFAISPTTFVTAAHVIGLGITSQFGAPAIRDSDGKVYPIDRILKYSNHEDFVLFTVSGAPPVSPLATNTAAAIDDPVFAVGNALGEGIVIRDGLLTSLTPEAQDGALEVAALLRGRVPGQQRRPLARCPGPRHRPGGGQEPEREPQLRAADRAAAQRPGEVRHLRGPRVLRHPQAAARHGSGRLQGDDAAAAAVPGVRAHHARRSSCVTSRCRTPRCSPPRPTRSFRAASPASCWRRCMRASILRSWSRPRTRAGN